MTENKVVVQQFLEALNNDNLGALSEICSPKIAEEWSGGIQQGPFTNHHMDVKETVAEGDKVMVVLATQAAVTGDFHGIPPSGKHVSNEGAVFFRLADDKITQVDTYFDELHQLTDQLGATITPPGS